MGVLSCIAAEQLTDFGFCQAKTLRHQGVHGHFTSCNLPNLCVSGGAELVQAVIGSEYQSGSSPLGQLFSHEWGDLFVRDTESSCDWLSGVC